VSHCYRLVDGGGDTVDAKTVWHSLLAALLFYSSKLSEVSEAELYLTNLIFN
jgi:hypothetical protein